MVRATEKRVLVRLSCIFTLIFLSVLSTIAYAQSPVYVEFFYTDPSQFSNICYVCPGWKDVLSKYAAALNLVNKIETDYGDQVHVERVDKTSEEGRQRSEEYEVTLAQAVVLNHKIKLEGDQLTEEDLKKYIDAYLRGEDPTSVTVQPVSAVFAFSTGLVSGLSPCLMAMLGFILSYTSGTVSSFKGGMFRVSVFGIGFVSALLLIGALLAAVLVWFPSFAITMTWAASVLIIIVGLNLVGLLPIPSALKSLGQKLGSRGRVELAQRYRATTIGLFSLGFLFYFVNFCTAPLSFSVLPTLTAPSNIYLLPLFAIGALLPFFAVGIIAGGSPALAKSIGQQHRLKIRALSGAVLLVYSVWLIGFNLLATEMVIVYPRVVGFSQSLIVMFAFVLIYSVSVGKGFKDALGRTVAFALGLVSGTVLVTMPLALVGVSFYLALFSQLRTITIAVAAIMILAGLSLTGILTHFISSQSLLQRLAARHSIAILGLFLLGFLAFFATVRTFPLTRFIVESITEEVSIDTNLLLAFNSLLLVPFLVIGIISGITPRIAGGVFRKHQLKIRAFSGIVLITYAVWLLVQQFA